MGIDFKPQNALEQAIHDRNSKMVIYAIAENHMLATLAPASNLGYECFSDEVIYAVLLIAFTRQQLEMMSNGWFWGYLKAGERLRKLIDEALAPLPQAPTDAEKNLSRQSFTVKTAKSSVLLNRKMPNFTVLLRNY